MGKKLKTLQKVFSFIVSFNLIFQTFFGLIPTTFSYAQEVTPTETQQLQETQTPESEVTFEITPEVTPEIALEVTPETILEVTPEVTPQETPSPTEEQTVSTTDPEILPTIEPTPTIDETTLVVAEVPTLVPQTATESQSQNNQQEEIVSTTPTEVPVTPTIVVEEPKVPGQLSAMVIENVAAPSLDLSVGEETSACLVTDKADYAPTDSALIIGTSFTSDKKYTLIISSTDDPAITFEDEVTTDEKGAFIYAYQLDGNYRPNYKVEVKDKNDIIASTTFTDSNPLLAAIPETDFSMIVLPDTQNYSTSYPATFSSQTQFVVDNKDTLNIAFVTHEGDIVNTANSTTEWNNADTAMDILDGTREIRFLLN